MSVQFKNEDSRILRETYGDGSQLGKPDRRGQRMANRWLHGGLGADDQMAGLVAPPEPTMGVAAHLGLEGVHHHRQHPDHPEMHRLVRNITLISELNGTIHDWPWPASVATHQK